MSRRRKPRFETRNNTPAYDTYFSNVLNTPLVNAKTAESISTVYACISAISETIASLPFEVYKRTETGREKGKTILVNCESETLALFSWIENFCLLRSNLAVGK